jgi:hypothetical protein
VTLPWSGLADRDTWLYMIVGKRIWREAKWVSLDGDGRHFCSALLRAGLRTISAAISLPD